MSQHRLTINPGFREVDPPSGGGKGPDALYFLTVLIDDKPALFLTRESFKKPGQMHAFLETIERLAAADQ